MAITLPFTFTNGTVIEAPQVNANFSALANVAIGPGAPPLTVSSGGTGLSSFPTTPAALSAPILGWSQWGIEPFLRGADSAIHGTTGEWTSGGVTFYGVVGSWGDSGSDVAIVTVGTLPYIVSGRAEGTPTAPIPPPLGISLLDIAGGAYLGLGPSGKYWDSWMAYMSFVTAEAFSPTSHATAVEIVTTDVGVAGDPWAAPHIFYFGREGNFTIEGQFHSPYPTIAPSDTRLKKQVEAYTHGLAELQRLEVVTYCYNGRARIAPDNGRRFVGLEAEKVRDVIPEIVDTMKVTLDPKPMRRPDVRNPNVVHEVPDTDVLTVRSGDLTFLLINAVKQLATRVNALEQRRG